MSQEPEHHIRRSVAVNLCPVHRKHRRFMLEYTEGPVPVAACGPAGAGDRAPVERSDPGLDRTQLAIGILGAAAGLGLLGDGLLRIAPLGLNVIAWTAALVALLLLLVRRSAVQLSSAGRFLLVAALLFAAAFAWRDSAMLKAANGLTVLAALALVSVYGRVGSRVRLEVVELALSTAGGFMLWLFGLAGLLVGDIRWRTLSVRSTWRPWLAAARGTLVALPLLLLFGGLFASADAAFEGIVRRIFAWQLDQLVGHLFFAAALSWPVAGLLRLTVLGDAPSNRAGESGGQVGCLELSIVLGLLNALFVTFVAVQGSYFFGGAMIVESTPQLTYAEYARRGFFELVAVAALVLPLLLLAHWLLDKRSPRQVQLFNVQAGSLVVLLMLVIGSALQRMRLYQEIYGQTELRLYATAFMLWLAVLLVWFVVTVLRGRRELFAVGLVASGFGALACLNGLNPDALIAKTNAGRQLLADAGVTVASGRGRSEPLDERYLLRLSADAAPELIASLDRLETAKRVSVARALLARWSPPDELDWRSWSIARSEARRAVADRRGELESIAAATP
jgi:hypothetical protein